MTATSKIEIPNKKIPFLEYDVYVPEKGTTRKIKEPNFILKIGSELEVVSSALDFSYKDGKFYVCKNKKGEVVFLDENELEIVLSEDENIFNLLFT